MSKYKLAISIITYERPKDIDLMLANIADFTKKLSIGIYIFDGSIKNDTEDVVKKYLDNGFGNIEYKKYENPDLLLRTYDMFNVPDCEYLWPIRDRMFFMDINVYKYIITLFQLSPTVISVFHMDKPQLPVNFFYSKNDYIKQFIYRFSYLGSYIIKKSEINYIDKSIYKKNFAISWIQIAVALDAIVKSNEFLGIQTSFDNSMLHNIETSHSWDETDAFIRAMFEHKLEFILDFVNKNKEYNVKELALCFGLPNSMAELLFLRDINRINLKTYKRFYNVLRNYTKLSRFLFLITITPRPLATLLRACFKIKEFCLAILNQLYNKAKYFIDYKIKH